MSMYLIIFVVAIILAGAIGTIVIGVNPKEEGYTKNTGSNYRRLLLYYGISTVILIAIFIYLL